MLNNQRITVSFKHKRPFIRYIKTGYFIPWEYSRIKKAPSWSDLFKMYMRQFNTRAILFRFVQAWTCYV